MQYLKIHLTAFIILLILGAVLILWFWPAQNNLKAKIYNIDDKISQNTDIITHNIIDTVKDSQLHKQLNEVKSPKEKFTLLQMLFYYLLLCILTPIGGTLIQWLYTKIKFTSYVNQTDLRVLSTALLISGLIAIATFLVFYWPSLENVL
jgi:hypothetical protein